jgi:hypothetical protein
MLTLNF